MQNATLRGAMMLGAILLPLVAHAASKPSPAVPTHAKSVAPPEPPIESGVYGFSGGGVPNEPPAGVVGECIWVFDAANKAQVAKGRCDERSPGKFRVVLKPGHYVVHGPGGNQPINIKRGGWVKVVSVVSLPVGP
jgi:hypothetical protein